MTIGELLKVIGGLNNECDMDLPIYIAVSRPGMIGAPPKVAVESACYGFDWNIGKFILYPKTPLIDAKEGD